MTDIVQKITKRNQKYNDRTDEILDELRETVLEGIAKFLVSVDPKLKNQHITWSDVEYDGELFFLFGKISFEPGSTFYEDGKKVEITENNAAYFNRIIKIAVPEDVLKGDQKQVITYLKRMEEQNNMIIEGSSGYNNEILTGFNLEDLTDEQRNQLYLHQLKGSHNNEQDS